MDYNTSSQALAVCIAANVPVILWGPPGAGKSTTMEKIAEAQGLHLEVIVASIRDPTDFAGIPFIHEGASHLAPPRWAKEIITQETQFKRPSLAVYDEISTATPAVQGALLRPILEKYAGDAKLPESLRSVGTANPPSIAADGWEPSLPLANRFTHLDWELEAEVVKEGFMNGFPVPQIPMLPITESARERRYATAKSLVGVFLGSRPHLVSVMPKNFGASDTNFAASDYAYPTPRSWDMASKLYAVWQMARINGQPLSPSVLTLLLQGTVGFSASTEFLQYVEQLDLPDPIQYLMAKVEIPESLKRGDQVEAFLSSVEYAYRSTNPSSNLWNRYGDALSHFVKIGRADAAYRYILSWYSQRPEGTVPSGVHVEHMGMILEELES